MGDSADVPRIVDAVAGNADSFALIEPPIRHFHDDPALTAWRVGQIRSKLRMEQKRPDENVVSMLPRR